MKKRTFVLTNKPVLIQFYGIKDRLPWSMVASFEVEVLYFFPDDRCIVLHGLGEYICLLITSFSTSTGHFLSLNKSHLNRPQTTFVYLGIEFDVPRQLIRIPSKRKEKIRHRLTILLADLGYFPFFYHFLPNIFRLHSFLFLGKTAWHVDLHFYRVSLSVIIHSGNESRFGPL